MPSGSPLTLSIKDLKSRHKKLCNALSSLGMQISTFELSSKWSQKNRDKITALLKDCADPDVLREGGLTVKRPIFEGLMVRLTGIQGNDNVGDEDHQIIMDIIDTVGETLYAFHGDLDPNDEGRGNTVGQEGGDTTCEEHTADEEATTDEEEDDELDRKRRSNSKYSPPPTPAGTPVAELVDDEVLKDRNGIAFDPKKHQRIKCRKCIKCKTEGGCFVDRNYRGTKPKDIPYIRCTNCISAKVTCRKHGQLEPVPIPREDLVDDSDDTASVTPEDTNPITPTPVFDKTSSRLVSKKRKQKAVVESEDEQPDQGQPGMLTDEETADPHTKLLDRSLFTSNSVEPSPPHKRPRSNAITVDKPTTTASNTLSQIASVSIFMGNVAANLDEMEHARYRYRAQRDQMQLEINESLQAIIRVGRELLNGSLPSHINQSIYARFLKDSSLYLETVNSVDPSAIANAELPLGEANDTVSNLLKLLGSR